MGGYVFNGLDYPGWECTLSQERQPSLHSVEIAFAICYGEGCEHPERKLAAVKQMLPKLDARGILFLSLLNKPA